MRFWHFVLACILAGVAIFCGMVAYKLYKERDTVDYTVVVGGEEQAELAFSLTEMYPGYSSSYAVRVKSSANKSRRVSVRFLGEGTLAPFVDVTLSLGEETLYTASLEECLKGQKISLFTIETDADKEISLTYGMGLDIGDEAQNTQADFRVVFLSED